MHKASAILVFTCAVTGCASGDHIVITESNSNRIINGIVDETAELQIPSDSTLIVPENAVVVNDNSLINPRVIVTKELAIFGHPPSTISMREMRHTFGVAQMATADSLVIATFGEYAVDGHGGASVDLKFLLPKNVKWQRSNNLSGPNNATGPRNEDNSLNEGWTKIETRSE